MSDTATDFESTKTPELNSETRERLAYEQELELRETIRHFEKFLSIGAIGKQQDFQETKAPTQAFEIHHDLVKLFKELYSEDE